MNLTFQKNLNFRFWYSLSKILIMLCKFLLFAYNVKLRYSTCIAYWSNYIFTDPLSSQPLYTLGGNKHYELMYSLGVSFLHAGQPSKAFDCFTEAAQKLHNNPKLWLRMAECCIHSHKSVSYTVYLMNFYNKYCYTHMLLSIHILLFFFFSQTKSTSIFQSDAKIWCKNL